MPFTSIDDPEFWKNCPKGLELISKSMEGTGSGVAYFVMGEPKDNAPTVVALRMAPNWVLPRHAHDCYRFEVVVQGTLDVGERVLKVGDVMFSEPNIFMGLTSRVRKDARRSRFSAITQLHTKRFSI